MDASPFAPLAAASLANKSEAERQAFFTDARERGDYGALPAGERFKGATELTIFTPNFYTGKVFGVPFTDGQAEVTQRRKNPNGYNIEQLGIKFTIDLDGYRVHALYANGDIWPPLPEEVQELQPTMLRPRIGPSAAVHTPAPKAVSAAAAAAVPVVSRAAKAKPKAELKRKLKED